MSRDALIVGINKYKSDRLSNLSAPAYDAEAIGERLETDGEFNVWRLPEALDRDTKKPIIGQTLELSLNELQKALVELFKPDSKQIPDTALFYFSGHGLRQNLGISEGFLATSDVKPESGFNGLSLQWLRRLLQESPVRQQIIWLDCCHSGELINFEEANSGGQGKAKDYFFLASSREFEVAYEDLESQYSFVTKVLLEGLNPHRYPQEWVTNYSLVDYINKNLTNANQRPICSNAGEKINLTRTSEVKIAQIKGKETGDICPYKGLEYFTLEDAEYFYGREKLTDELVDKVRQSNFLAILGASGSGKSSVLRAGLLYELQQGLKLGGSQHWQIYVLVPTNSPRQSLAYAFLDANQSDTDRAIQLNKINTLLKDGAEGLTTFINASQSEKVVIVIDQFEEIFTLCQDLAERENFLKCILGALSQTEKLCLILAMRADFLLKCLEHEYSGLQKKIQENLITVTPMNKRELKEAIIKPAEKAKLIVEDTLVTKMLTDVKSAPSSLPLLEDTLTELWKRRNNNVLELDTYIKLGGVTGTLNQRATAVYQGFNEQERDTAKYIFLALTTLGEGTEDTRRRVIKGDLITAKYPESLIDRVVQKLADEKLIVTDSQQFPPFEGNQQFPPFEGGLGGIKNSTSQSESKGIKKFLPFQSESRGIKKFPPFEGGLGVGCSK